MVRHSIFIVHLLFSSNFKTSLYSSQYIQITVLSRHILDIQTSYLYVLTFYENAIPYQILSAVILLYSYIYIRVFINEVRYNRSIHIYVKIILG